MEGILAIIFLGFIVYYFIKRNKQKKLLKAPIYIPPKIDSTISDQKQPPKKKKFKKIAWISAISLFAIFAIFAIIGMNVDPELAKEKREQKAKDRAISQVTEKESAVIQTPTEENSTPQVTKTKTELMTETINNLIKSDGLYRVTVTRLNINNNASKNDGRKIALVYLKWTQRNSPELTRQILAMNSARIVGKALSLDENIQEAVLFWEVPYHKENQNIAKFNYFKKDGEFYEGDKWYDPVIR